MMTDREIKATELIVEATKLMGWKIAVADGDPNKEMEGVIIGTDEYIEKHMNMLKHTIFSPS